MKLPPSWKFPPSWSQLRALGSSRLLRSSYFWLFFVPVAAKVAQKVESPVFVEIFNERFPLQLELPFSWFAFYFAAVAFSIAGLLYSWRCPKAIKDFPNFHAFYLAGNGVRALRDLMPDDFLKGPNDSFAHELRAALKRSGSTESREPPALR